MPLTNSGKKLMAVRGFEKGKAFIGASLLLCQKGSGENFEYVTLHLLCQGVEIILKSLLLLQDFNKYYPMLQEQKKLKHHDLCKIAEIFCNAYAVRFRPAVKKELRGLTAGFASGGFRYASLHDVFIAPNTIPHRNVFRWIGAIVRMANRELMKPK
jgi:hypothetical protein